MRTDETELRLAKLDQSIVKIGAQLDALDQQRAELNIPACNGDELAVARIKRLNKKAADLTDALSAAERRRFELEAQHRASRNSPERTREAMQTGLSGGSPEAA